MAVEGEVLQDEPDEVDPQEAAELQVRRRVALAQIRQYPDAALRLRANEVTAFDDVLARLARRMGDLMRDARGVGLAATQIGVLQRLFVFQLEADEEPTAVVNPELAERSSATEVLEEGCLSLQGVLVPVERSVAVTLRGRDLDGGPLELRLDDLDARVAQHELDHLDGVLMLERTDQESRREALATLRRNLRA